jgi:hypothetical protein
VLPCCVRETLRRVCATLVLCALSTAPRSGLARDEPPLEVVWLETASAEMEQRVEGQLSDTNWRLAPHSAQAGKTRLAQAFGAARQRGARAVAWVESDAALLELYILDVQRSRLSRREIPTTEDPTQRSATLETVALIVRATLQSIEAGAEVGDQVVEPAAPAPPLPLEPRPRPDVPPRADDEGALDEGAAGWARFGVSVAHNLGSVFAGAALGGGAQFDALRVGASLRASLPQHAAFSLGDGTRGELELWRAGIAVSAEYGVALSREWSGYLAASGALGLLHRALEQSDGLQPSAARIHPIPSVGAQLGLEFNLNPRHTWLELSLGLDYLLRVPHFRVGPAPSETTSLQLQRLEPSAGLALRFR